MSIFYGNCLGSEQSTNFKKGIDNLKNGAIICLKVNNIQIKTASREANFFTNKLALDKMEC
jgi:hypothetical protein